MEENILKKANQKRMLGDMAIEGGNFTTTFFKEQTISELFSEPSGLDSLVKEKEDEEREKQKRAEEQKEQIKEEEEKVDTKAVVQFEKVGGQETICSHKFHKLNIFKFSKICVKQPLSKRPKFGLKINYRLMQVKSIAECSKGSILQYFRTSLSYRLSLRSLFCPFLSGHFTHVRFYCSPFSCCIGLYFVR